MTRTRLSLISTTAFASILGAAVPAFAQAPMPMAPAPMMAPAPVMAPQMAPAPGMQMMAPEAVMPVAPMVAPKAADDMSGSVGFGVGVVSGASTLISPNTGNLMMKYWVNDAMALLPKLSIGVSKVKDGDTAWNLAPSLMADFTMIKGASTRFSAGIGVGLSLGKTPVEVRDPTTGAVTTAMPKDATIGLFLPAGLNVEHYFTRWFSMGVGAYFNLIDFQKTGDAWKFALDINNVKYLGSLFFYTD